MSHPLEQKLARVRGRLRRLVVVYGLSWLVGGVLVAMLVLGLADYVIRIEDRGLRVLGTLAVLTTAGWTFYRYLLAGLVARWADVDLAERLGREFPSLGDGLPSAVEFLCHTEEDPTAGSLTLRRAVIAQTTAEAERLDFRRAIHPGPVVRAVLWTTAVCLLALILVVTDPAASRIAVARLANPFGGTAWPQSTHLAIFERDPTDQRIALGDAFEVELVALDGAAPATGARIHYRYRTADGKSSVETRVMRPKDTRLVARRSNVAGSFSYSVDVETTRSTKSTSVGDPPQPVWFAVRVVPPGSEAKPGGDVGGSTESSPAPVEGVRVVRPALRESDEPGVRFDGVALLVREHRLERVVRGESFEVRVVDAYGRALPSDARIQYRFQDADGNTTEETEAMHPLDGQLVARRDDVARAFSYRVSGGDDDSMPWIPVVLVEPPSVTTLSVKLFPPDYTGWPPGETDGYIHALVGTRVEISARANRSLYSAMLHLEAGEVVKASVSGPDRRNVHAEFVVGRSGAYWFELIDRDRLAGGTESRWEIRAVPDKPPVVTIREPATNLLVTPEAELPLRVAVEDDLSIRRIDLSFSRSDRPDVPAAVRPLYVRPGDVGPASALLAEAHRGEDREVTDRWRLGDLDLVPGSYVTFHATATDDRPNLASSQPRRLSVITPEELAERISGKQAYVLAELSRVLKIQRESRRQVAATEIRLGEVGSLGQSDLDHLRGAQLNQRQVKRTLTSQSDGLPMHVLGLLADLKNNHVDSPDVRDRMQAILDEIDRLAAKHLPVIDQELTAGIKAAQIALEENALAENAPGQPGGATETPDPRIGAALAATGRQQDQVIDSLEQLLGQLARWDDYRRFQSQIGQLLRDQEELTQETIQLARRTMTKDLRDLTPEETAGLKTAGRRQFELARALDRLQQAMEQAAGRLADSDPGAAETVADALARAHELTTAGRMRSGGKAIGANRLGRAIEEQKQVAQDLREILDVLANRRQHDLARLAKKLRQAEAELDEILQRQADIEEQFGRSTEGTDENQRRRQLQNLATEQEQLREEAQRMARQLERLSAPVARKRTQSASEEMGQASRSARQDSAGEAREEAEQAKRNLQEALRLVAEKRRQAEVDLAAGQFAELKKAVAAIRDRQREALDETGRLDGLLKNRTDELTPAESAAATDLARRQWGLVSETNTVAEKLVGADVFDLALSQAAGEMDRAAGLMGRHEFGSRTQRAQRSAVARLDQLLEALEPQPPQDQPEETDQPGGPQAGDGPADSPPSPGDAMKILAELKLLRMLQQEVNLRTKTLEESSSRPERRSPEALREYTRLSQEQGRLAELLLGVIQEEAVP